MEEENVSVSDDRDGVTGEERKPLAESAVSEDRSESAVAFEEEKKGTVPEEREGEENAAENSDSSAGDPLLQKEEAAEKKETPEKISRVVPTGPGRDYETLVLLSSRLDTEAVKKVADEIQAFLESNGANAVVQDHRLGRRRLAYEIGDHTEGVYVNFTYRALPPVLGLLDHFLKMREDVLRFLTTLKSGEKR